MFLLIAESTGFYDLLVIPKLKGTVLYSIGLQFHHHPWNGIRLWDLGQPFFMFISGVAMWFSYTRQWGYGETWKKTFLHAIQRSFLLFFSGWAIYQIVPAESNPQGAFLYDVLPQLALASMIAFLLMKRPAVLQFVVAFGFIGFSEFFYRIWPISGFNEAFALDHNFGSYLDRLLTGEISAGHWVAFNIVPSVAFVIWGVLAGRLLSSQKKPPRKIFLLSLIGLSGLIIGLIISLFTPLIRRIFTSSFIVLSGGFALIALALSYWIIDVLKFRKWTFFFVVVGMNPIFIYLFTQSGGGEWFRQIVEPFSIGGFGWLGGFAAQFATSLTTLGLLWLLCYWLCKNKIFIRI